MANPLRFVPLGGLGDIGRNMSIFEYGRNILIVDAGVMFPENDMLGVDVVIPNFEYLRDKKDWVRGIVITHGHEDHTGALPYLLEEVQAPIYSTRLVLALVERKLKERLGRRYKADLNEVTPGQSVRIGPFQVHTVALSHSIPDSMALAIDTPIGRVVHSGDFKIDFTPPGGDGPDIAQLAALAAPGTLALFSDSTGAERAGFTPSEKTIEPAFDRIMRESPGRVIVASFASQLHRIQQLIDISHRYNRKVAIAGRSMQQNFDIARKLGYLRVPKGTYVRLETTHKLPPQQVTLLITGSQGQPEAALARIAAGRHREITLNKTDTVVISAHPIPGNEEEVSRVINQLVEHGVEVVYPPIAHVHVSGHASQEEMKMILALVRPKFFIPIHGEPRHLHLHARLAESMGLAREQIFELRDGDVLEITPERCQVVEKVPGGYVFVDGTGVGDVGPQVLRERDALARGGFVSAVIVVERKSRKLAAPPQISTRGVIYSEQSGATIEGAEAALRGALERGKRSTRALQEQAREALGRYFYQTTRRRPVIVVSVIEVD
ncbi:MAG: ribonuclease J [Caldilineae bacterium]|nr:MAG: ribonuclease J [Caldilineae bacterium]